MSWRGIQGLRVQVVSMRSGWVQGIYVVLRILSEFCGRKAKIIQVQFAYCGTIVAQVGEWRCRGTLWGTP